MNLGMSIKRDIIKNFGVEKYDSQNEKKKKKEKPTIEFNKWFVVVERKAAMFKVNQ